MTKVRSLGTGRISYYANPFKSLKKSWFVISSLIALVKPIVFAFYQLKY